MTPHSRGLDLHLRLIKKAHQPPFLRKTPAFSRLCDRQHPNPQPGIAAALTRNLPDASQEPTSCHRGRPEEALAASQNPQDQDQLLLQSRVLAELQLTPHTHHCTTLTH